MSLEKTDLDGIFKVAHRGFRVGVDENTFDAFDKSIEMGADIIECDIRYSKDLKMIIIHDQTVDRTMKGKGRVQDLTLSELKELKGAVHDYQIPTAEELITTYASRIKLMIEIKDERVPEELANLIKYLNVNDRIIFSGRNPDEFIRIRNILPDAKFCHNITGGKYYSTKTFLRTKTVDEMPLKFDMISLSVQKMSKKFIKKCTEYDIIPLCWNLLPERNPAKTVKKMLKLGIKGILFDNPHTLNL